MAKILVADDNSNIQKMVGLALKDQGIDVVAVGNGEAAVRKISDLRPDLVLADVFMPVRNGYEVCEYVKDDASLAHIPVILLVGAFDPLDEQEAQRVRADGVLKKPFVPPDPLISMVKSALTRCGVLEREAAEKEAAAAAAKAKLAPPPPKILSLPKENPTFDEEPLPEEFSTRPPMLKIEPGGQSVAFESLLATPGAGVAEDPEQTVVPSTGTAERDWRALEPAEEPVEEESSAASWRRDAAEDAFAAADKIPSQPADWRETTLTSEAKSSEPWAPTEEKHAIVEEQIEAPTATPAWAEALAARLAAPQTPAKDAWASASTTSDVNEAMAERLTAEQNAVLETVVAETQHIEDAGHVDQVPSISSPILAHSPVETLPPPSWLAAPAASPWDADKQRADLLASTWSVPASEPVSVITAPPMHHEAAYEETTADAVETAHQAHSEPVHEESVAEHVPEHHDGSFASATAHVEEPMQESQPQTAEPDAHAAIEQKPVAPFSAAQEHVAATAQPPTQESTEDIVARVMAKMSPEVLQAVTREILKPVIEAMVRDELNSKKQ